MMKLFKATLLAAVLYGAWIGLSQTDILSKDIRFRVHGEYGALLGGRH
jgi:hypothetical protein